MLSPTATIVQRSDPERFTTALFAPAELRETLFTLYAFNHELARAREAASIPPLALIRLQWWRDVVQGANRRHEVATPLSEAIAAGRLDRDCLLRMIDARELEAEETITPEQQQHYLAETGGLLMAEAGRLLGGERDYDALMAQGVGCAAVGLLRNEGAHGLQYRWVYAEGCDRQYVQDFATTCLGAGRQWCRQAIPAALPVVLARRYLRGAGGGTLGTGGRLAIWSASIRGWF